MLLAAGFDGTFTEPERMTTSGGLHLDNLALTHAARLVVRSMGNGVDRVEVFDLIPIGQAKIDTALTDREPVPSHYAARFFDLAIEAAKLLGISGLETANDYAREVYARPVDANAVEIIFWRKRVAKAARFELAELE
jgi:hypothetical protein